VQKAQILVLLLRLVAGGHVDLLAQMVEGDRQFKLLVMILLLLEAVAEVLAGVHRMQTEVVLFVQELAVEAKALVLGAVFFMPLVVLVAVQVH